MRHVMTGLAGAAMMAAILLGAPQIHAAPSSLQDSSSLGGTIQVRFDGSTRQTRIQGNVASDLCFSLSLPQEWRVSASGLETRLMSETSGWELTISLRSSHELRALPQPDLTSRDAALLQQDYESLLGRPAQSVSLASLAKGAAHWSATWVDAHLPSGPMTVETVIVPLSQDWVLELSPSNVATKQEHDHLMHRLLVDLNVQRRSDCHAQEGF